MAKLWKNNPRIYMRGLIVVVSTLILFMLLTNTASYQFSASAEANQLSRVNNTLHVTGMAETHMTPEKVTVSFEVETTDKKAEVALNKNSKMMNDILNSLKSAGVREDNITTSSFSLRPDYDYSYGTTKDTIIGYEATNSIMIEGDRLSNVSQWIDKAISAGASRVNYVDFGLSDKQITEAKATLLKDALANARMKAEIAAKSNGLHLAGIMSMDLEDSGSYSSKYNRYDYGFAGASDLAAAPSSKPSTPVFAGERDLSQKVDIIYLLGK